MSKLPQLPAGTAPFTAGAMGLAIAACLARPSAIFVEFYRSHKRNMHLP